MVVHQVASEAVAQPVALVDNRLIPVQVPDRKWLEKQGLQWLDSGENADYLANRVVAFTEREVYEMQDAARELYRMQLETAQYIANNRLWEQAGIPKEAIPLMEYSLREEQHLHLIGR